MWSVYCFLSLMMQKESPVLNMAGRTFLITGIADQASLAMSVAQTLEIAGARLVVAGLGRTEHHRNLSEKSTAFLDRTFQGMQEAVQAGLSSDVTSYAVDLSLDASIDDMCKALAHSGVRFDGVLHSVAMDKTIRGGTAVPLLETTREEFLSAMDVSAYSLLALTRSMLSAGLLNKGASIIALSYLGAERVMHHPYRNIGVAKAALERMARELAQELGVSDNIRVNAVRFSPYTGSKAGGAIPGLQEAVERCERESPLGNAKASDLAELCAFLFAAGHGITGQILHVDGGYSIRG